MKPFFCIIVSEPIWCEKEDPIRAALIDHELCHCGARRDNDGNTVLRLIPHDLEEFNAVIDRHGIWKQNVKRMARSMAFYQGQLDLDGAGKK